MEKSEVVIESDKHEEILENTENNVVEEKDSVENSEYNSAESDEELEQVKERSKASDLDVHSESADSAILEREEGDGQESVPANKVDHDEDKKNPQYIPKKGTFYEHDDRTASTGETEEQVEPEKDTKKKVWQEIKEKWRHDRFNDKEQTPKTKSELVAIYGYDIRNEDSPPKARRRRRYGRGPNKYTRNWEDQDAYSKPSSAPQRNPIRNRTYQRRSKTGEELASVNKEIKSKTTELGTKATKSYQENSNNESNTNNSNVKTALQRKGQDNLNEQQQLPKQQKAQINNPIAEKSSYSVQGQNRGLSKTKSDIKTSDYKGFTKKTRQQRGVRNENQQILPAHNAENERKLIYSQNFTNKMNHKQMLELEKNISDLNIHDSNSNYDNSNIIQNANRQGSMPPRLQHAEQKGPKRYSSMRQRSLPETSTTPAANFSFYPSDYNSAAPPPATQQPILPPVGPLVPTQQVPVTAAPPPILQASFPTAAAFPSTAPSSAFIAPGPTPFIAATSQPTLMNYVPQQQQPFVPGFQNQFNSVVPPAELYSPQGITYYSTDQQHVMHRSALQKRVNSAIPIIAPTDLKGFKEQMNNQIETDVHVDVAENISDVAPPCVSET